MNANLRIDRYLGGNGCSVDQWSDICGMLGIEHVNISLITGRCGSTFVGGVCRSYRFGNGGEPFNERVAAEWSRLGSGSDLKQFFEALIGPRVLNGRLYFQITAERLSSLLKVLPVLDHPSVTFSLIFRRNLFAQALSFYNAHQSGVWQLHGKKLASSLERFKLDRSPIYFILMILRLEEESVATAGSDVRPFYYEDIIAARYEAMHLFLRTQGVAVEAERLATAVQADSLPRKLIREGYGMQYEALRQEIDGFDALLLRRFTCGYDAAVNRDIANAVRPA